MASLKLFFTSDVHGSDKCLRKFINAGKFYQVDVIILGGDVTGKLIAPIIQQKNGDYITDFMEVRKVVKEVDIEALKEQIRFAGQYPFVTVEEEISQLKGDKQAVDRLFIELMKEKLAQWMSFAVDRLEGTGIKCVIMPGNDDPYGIDDGIQDARTVIYSKDEVINLKDDYWMLSIGNSNMTPWKAPRDITEDELERKINHLAMLFPSFSRAIFNIHVPPFDTEIDRAPDLDKTLRPKRGGSQFANVGSTAVRKAIEKYQPLISLHGHIHESRGFCKIGRTMCFNPGSEYSEGMLHGVLIELLDDEVKSHLLTAG